jgi:hypothetical protein
VCLLACTVMSEETISWTVQSDHWKRVQYPKSTALKNRKNFIVFIRIRTSELNVREVRRIGDLVISSALVGLFCIKCLIYWLIPVR